MYTPADFALIEKGLGLAKDKGKYLESFEIPIETKEFAFGPDKYENSFLIWKDKLKASYLHELHKEYLTELKPAEAKLTKEMADVQKKIETNRKRYREY
jgi:hypothetical protein